MTIRLKFSSEETPPTVPEVGRPIRIMVYPDRPDVILVYVPDNASLRLPELRPPFDRQQVVEACRQAGIPARVSESRPGRFRESMHAVEVGDRVERGQHQLLTEAARHAAALKLPETTVEHQRAQLVLKKRAVDEEMRQLKADLAKAKSRTYYGRDRQRERMARLKIESQALQMKLGELRRVTRAENIAKHDAEEVAKKFMDAATRLLAPDWLDEIWSEMLVHDDDSNSGDSGDGP